MTDDEEWLRQTLTKHALEAPAVTEVAIPTGRRRSIPWAMLAPVGAAVGAAVLVLAVATLATEGEPLDVTPASTAAADVTELTGDELGAALGLEPLYDNTITGCADGAEHGDHAYCLDGVTDDPLEMQILKMQIVGYPRTSALVEYSAALLRLDELENTTDPKKVAEIQQLVESMAELKERMTKETD